MYAHQIMMNQVDRWYAKESVMKREARNERQDHL